MEVIEAETQSQHADLYVPQAFEALKLNTIEDLVLAAVIVDRAETISDVGDSMDSVIVRLPPLEGGSTHMQARDAMAAGQRRVLREERLRQRRVAASDNL